MFNFCACDFSETILMLNIGHKLLYLAGAGLKDAAE